MLNGTFLTPGIVFHQLFAWRTIFRRKQILKSNNLKVRTTVMWNTRLYMVLEKYFSVQKYQINTENEVQNVSPKKRVGEIIVLVLLTDLRKNCADTSHRFGDIDVSRVQGVCYEVCLLLIALANIAKQRARPYVCVIV